MAWVKSEGTPGTAGYKRSVAGEAAMSPAAAAAAGYTWQKQKASGAYKGRGVRPPTDLEYQRMISAKVKRGDYSKMTPRSRELLRKELEGFDPDIRAATLPKLDELITAPVFKIRSGESSESALTRYNTELANYQVNIERHETKWGGHITVSDSKPPVFEEPISSAKIKEWGHHIEGDAFVGTEAEYVSYTEDYNAMIKAQEEAYRIYQAESKWLTQRGEGFAPAIPQLTEMVATHKAVSTMLESGRKKDIPVTVTEPGKQPVVMDLGEFYRRGVEADTAERVDAAKPPPPPFKITDVGPLATLIGGYQIGTGKHVEPERTLLDTLSEERAREGAELAGELGYPSEQIMAWSMEDVSKMGEAPAVVEYKKWVDEVSGMYTPEVAAYYGRIDVYGKMPQPTLSQYDTLLKSKPPGAETFEQKMSDFSAVYSKKPSAVTAYESAASTFLTTGGFPKASVLSYEESIAAEQKAYNKYMGKLEEYQKFSPKYKKWVPFTYPILKAGKKATEWLIPRAEKYVPERWGKGIPLGIALTAAGTPQFFGTIPAGVETIFRKPSVAFGSIPLGLGKMAGGMTGEFRTKPGVATGRIVGMAVLPYAGKKLSPVRYTGKLGVPTGKGQIKSWYTFGKGLPREFKGIQEAGGFKAPIALGKIAPTKIPSIYKQTHLIPEVVTYKGLYLKTPSFQPYMGYHFMLGKIKGPKGTVRGWKVGQPKFELPTSYRAFTKLEAAGTLPSMKTSLAISQQRLMTEAFYLQKRLGRRPGVSKPVRFKEIEMFEGSPKGFQADVASYMRRYRRSYILYGSVAKSAQVARRSRETGGITPADVDIEIRTLGARMSEGIVLPKRFHSEYSLSRLGTPTLKSRFVQRVGEKVPGMTPSKSAAELRAIAEKYYGKENIIIEHQPTWQMYSVKRLTGKMEKTQWGMEPEAKALFDIHPESGTFEFGMKPHKPVKTIIETGLEESWWAQRKKIKMTPLGEEFERGFASLMQTQERGGVQYLGPRYQRLKDIPRFVQTGKMLTGYQKLKIETGLLPFKKYRLKGIVKEETALKHWEEYALTFKELSESTADITAMALSKSAKKALTTQMATTGITGVLRSKEGAITLGGARKPKFEDLYKPEPVATTKKAYTSKQEYYDPSKSDYYGKDYYSVIPPSYYGKPTYKTQISRKGAAPVFRPPKGIIPISPVKAGKPVFVQPTIKIPTAIRPVIRTPYTPFIPPLVLPQVPPFGTFRETAITAPPTRFLQPPPPPIPSAPRLVQPAEIRYVPFSQPVIAYKPPKKKEKVKKRKYKREPYAWIVKNPIPTMRQMMTTDINKITSEMKKAQSKGPVKKRTTKKRKPTKTTKGGKKKK